ncbi:MAG: DUF2914 domain-containing protein [Myxococcota bacterium]|nr:DUF2914 domain-containing protein [Myxococcota bacterium]
MSKPRIKEVAGAGWELAKTWSAAAAFVGGLGLDILTLGRIDDPTNVLLQGIYLVLAGTILCLSSVERSEWHYTGIRLRRLAARGLTRYGDFIFHFLMGALLSAFTIFYFKSASSLVSGLFLLSLVALLLLNELKSLQQLGPVFKVVLYQLAVVSYATYVIPLWVGEIRTGLFVSGVVISACVTAGLVAMMWKLGCELGQLKRHVMGPAALVLALFVGLYGFQVLPPIPLSVQFMGVFHGVERVDGNYHLQAESRPWYQPPWADHVYHGRDGEPVYIFTRVFAPRDFSDKVYLRWEHRRESGGWYTTDRIPLRIIGGRGLGFRGYAYKQNYQPGDWRTYVETADGREIGRFAFRIERDVSAEEAGRVRPLKTLIQ